MKSNSGSWTGLISGAIAFFKESLSCRCCPKGASLGFSSAYAGFKREVGGLDGEDLEPYSLGAGCHAWELGGKFVELRTEFPLLSPWLR